MGLKFDIPKTFKKAPDARLFFKCGILGLRYSIARSGYIKPTSHQPSTNEVTILTGRVANVPESAHGKTSFCTWADVIL